jgi:hypothetical protein
MKGQKIADQRVFTLIAATGLGKTLSSINFALKLRKRIQEKVGFSIGFDASPSCSGTFYERLLKYRKEKCTVHLRSLNF